MEIKSGWYRISAKALIYNEEGKFLLCKEEDGTWDLPWWGLDHWEYVLDCITRELDEEMGIEVISINPTPKVFIAAHKPSSKSRPWISNICYEVKVKDFNFIPSDECVEIWFFSPEEVEDINAIINVREVAKELLKLNN